MKTNKLGEWLDQTIRNIKGRTEFPLIEIYAISAYILGTSREWIVSHPEAEIRPDHMKGLEQAVNRLLEGEPLAYITGNRSFYGLDFFVDRNVLIPRPETEILVEEAISWLEHHPDRRKMADIGTGSGAIAVTCADHFPDLHITAVDISENALAVAQRNAEFHHVTDQIEFVSNDLLEDWENKFHLIAANLPYIPSEDLKTLTVSKFEPLLALDGGKDGLDFIRRLLEQSKNNLLAGGCVFLEIQYNQQYVETIAKQIFPLAVVTIFQDLASLPRVVKIQI